jgi:large subunit ribosomal protein L22
MEVIARAKYIRRAPRKARLVADMVRGLRVVEALAQLEFSPKHAAADVAKAIKSAAANAEHNHSLERDQLWLKHILVDEGPTMKRIRPVSRGMAHQYFHRTCHITAIVEDRPEPTPAARARRRATPRRAEEPVAPAEPVTTGQPSGAPQASSQSTEGDS